MTERIATECGCTTSGKIVRGMCRIHYDRWVHSTPAEDRGPAPRTARVFDDYIDASGDCWIWTGPTNLKGYGWWSGGGERGSAHRISLARVTPPADPGLLACHRCDNPPCVNPAHLYWGTAFDNARDVRERGVLANQNTYKTHCHRGHPLSGDNLRVVGKDQQRQCRTCDNERSRLKMAARRARQRAL